MNQLEHWAVEAGERGVARLDIPPHATRVRCFEIDVRLLARPGAAATPSIALRVLFDGHQQWSRRITIGHAGDDSLDWRTRRSVPVGQALRIQALAEQHAAMRLSLTITAEEIEG